jgi:carboxymethylenebutenolidase
MSIREIECELTTPSGEMRTFWAMPEGGMAPLAIMSPDGPGYRDDLKTLVRRFADSGFCCVLADWSYRFGPPVNLTDLKTAGGELMRRIAGILTDPENTLVADARLVIKHAESEGLALTGEVVAVGYCWGATAVVNLLAALPTQIVAGSGWHPFWLDENDQTLPMHVEGAPEPPGGPVMVPPRMLALLDAVRGELFWGVAETDRWINQASYMAFGDAMQKRGVRGAVETIRGTEHGFAVPGGLSYNQAASETHVAATVDLWRRNLRVQA